MIYGSVCSGIEAATVAWHPLGWQPSFFSEIDKFPRTLLTHHYPAVPLHGDFTTIEEKNYDPIDLLVGGTPCQSFSIAGLRKGLADDRGNLSLEFIRLAQRLRPRWILWENVPGVLSIDGGRAFGSFLGGLGECGYGFAYRVLDAQYFGVPQRRRRVFVVGYFGDWRPPAAVLFERESLQGDITPRRETREEPAGTLGARTCRSIGAQDATCGHLIPSTGFTSHCLNAGGMGRQDYETETLITHIDGGETARTLAARYGGRITDTQGPNVIAYGLSGNTIGRLPENGGNGTGYSAETAPTLTRRDLHGVSHGMTVRRLTPRECERLQGFPDDYTLIPLNNRGGVRRRRLAIQGSRQQHGCSRHALDRRTHQHGQ
jgi:DNA (cytosine-5)-methyltransferase 1